MQQQRKPSQQVTIAQPAAVSKASAASETVVEAVDNATLAQALFNAELAPGGKLNNHQINAFAETASIYNGPQGIHSAAVLGNAAASDPMAFPTGHLINYHEDAVVDPITLSPEALHYLVLCEIFPGKNQELDDAYFRGKLEEVGQAVPQYAGTPITFDTRSEDDNTDHDAWEAELGPSGSTGVLRLKRGPEVTYYVMANCTSPVIGQQFIDGLASRKQAGKAPTWREMVDSKDFKYWNNAVRRQACRIAHSVAAKLGVAISTTYEDGTYRPARDQAKHPTALPTHAQWISSIARSSTGAKALTRNVVTQYSKCSPVSRAQDRLGYHLVSISPFEGYHGVKVEANFLPKLGAFPCSTGRRLTPGEVEKLPPLQKKDMTRIQNTFTWEGKGPTAAINDRLHPEAYRPFDEEFTEQNFRSQGWTPNGKRAIEDLDVVILKIAARKGRPPTAK